MGMYTRCLSNCVDCQTRMDTYATVLAECTLSGGGGSTAVSFMHANCDQAAQPPPPYVVPPPPPTTDCSIIQLTMYTRCINDCAACQTNMGTYSTVVGQCTLPAGDTAVDTMTALCAGIRPPPPPPSGPAPPAVWSGDNSVQFVNVGCYVAEPMTTAATDSAPCPQSKTLLCSCATAVWLFQLTLGLLLCCDSGQRSDPRPLCNHLRWV